MAQVITGKCQEVLNKTEWVAILTWGEGGPHVVATWGDYVRAFGFKDDLILIPVGGYHKTEENLKKNDQVHLLIASRQVQGTNSMGQGYRIYGRGNFQSLGEVANLMKTKFS